MKQVLQNVAKGISFAAMFAMMLFVCENASAQFPAAGGNYTIDNVNVLTAYTAGSSTGNFTSFTLAIAQLNASSAVTLTGPITFTVTTGQTFPEVFSGLVINYSNPGNQLITFVSSNTGSTNPILSGKTGTSTAGGDPVLTITNGINYTFNHIDLRNDPANSGVPAEMEIGLNLTGNYNNITYENGTITLNNYLTAQTLVTFNIKGSGVAGSGLGIVNIIGNTMSNKGGATGTMGMNLTSLGNGSSINNNNITSLTTTGTITGISGVGTGTSVNVYQNTLSLTPVTGVTGIVGATLGNGSNIYQNSISVAAVTLGAASLGISETGALTNISIYGNTISPVTLGGANFAFTGINVPSIGTGAQIYQNLIGQTTMSGANAGAWTGINVSAAGTGSLIYGNTLSQTATAATGAYTGILATTMGTGNVSTVPGSGGQIYNNNITIGASFTTSGTNTPYGINAGNGATLGAAAIGPYCNIYGNTISVTQNAVIGSTFYPSGIIASQMGTGGQVYNNKITTNSTVAYIACGINVGQTNNSGNTPLGSNCSVYGNTVSATAAAGPATGIMAVGGGVGEQFYNNSITTSSANTGIGFNFGTVTTGAQGLGVNANVYGNTISVSTTTVLNGTATGISAPTSLAGSQIHDNTLTVTTTGTGAAIGLSATSLNINCSLYNNKINVSSSGSAVTGLGETNTTGPINIYGNTIGVSTTVVSLAVIGITATFGNNSNLYGNSITATTSVGGAVTGIVSANGGGTSGSNVNFYGNTINATSAVAASGTPVVGINVTDNWIYAIYNNILTVTATTTTGTGQVLTGIIGQGTGINNIYGNTVTGMVRAGGNVTAAGIQEIAGGTSNNMYLTGTYSKVYGNAVSVNSLAITLTGATALSNATGIYISAGNNPLIFNNSITNNKTGVISTSNSATVTGSGTKFLTQIFANDSLDVNGVFIGKVLSVGSDNSLTLTATATNTSLSNVNYAIQNQGSSVGIGCANISATIYGNTINGLTGGKSSTVTGLVAGGTNSIVNNNTIQNIYSITGVSGIVNLASVAGIFAGANNFTCYGNTISNVASGAGFSNAVTNGYSAGIYAAPGNNNVSSNYYDNSISSIYNLNPLATSANAYGMYEAGTGSVNFYSNTISNVHLDATASTGEATGVAVTAGSLNNVVYHENKVFNITNATTTASGNANGMRFTFSGSALSLLVYNNFIYHINADAGTLATTGGASRGIYVPSFNSYSMSFYNNTVYLDGAATGATAQVSTCFYLFANAVPSTVLDNILVNNSATTTSGSSFAYALWLGHAISPVPPNSSTQTFSSFSNNLLWAGTPGAKHVLLNHAGTPYQAISDYKALMVLNGEGDGTTAHTLTVTPASFFKSITVGSTDVHLGVSPGDASLQGLPLNSSSSPSLFSALYAVLRQANGNPIYLASLPNYDIDGDARPTSGNVSIGADESAACVTPVQPSAFTSAPTSIAPCATTQTYTVPDIPGVIFQWTVPTGVVINSGQNTSSISVSFLPNYVSGGTISVVTTSPACGTTSAARTTSPITINSLGVGSIAGPTTVCQNSAVAYLAYIPNAIAYSWTLPATTIVTNADAAPAYTVADIMLNWLTTAGVTYPINYPISVVGTDACGNTASVSLSVTVSSTVAPGATAVSATLTGNGVGGGNVYVCSGGALTLTGTPDLMTSYAWSGPGGYNNANESTTINNYQNNNPTFFATNGYYVLNVVDPSNGNCPAGAAAGGGLVGGGVIMASPLSTAIISTSPTSSVCGVGTILILSGSANSTPAADIYSWTGPTIPTGYQWNNSPPGVQTYTSGSQLNTIYNYFTATSGPGVGVGGTYALTVTDNYGCTATASTTISYSPLPTVTTSLISNICQGGTTAALGGTFTSSATSAVWSDGGAGGTFTNNTGSTPGTATYTAASGSSTPVPLTLTSSGGSCGIATALESVTVNASPTIGASSVASTVCPGGSTNLSATGGNTYVWAPSAALSSSTGSPVTATLTAATTYTVIGTAANTCTNSATVAVGLFASPTLNPFTVTENSGTTPNDGITCSGDAASITANEATGASPFTYLWTGGSTANPLSVSPGAGSPSYSVTVTDNNGCSVTGNTSLTVNALPSAPTFTIAETSGNANNDGTICNGDAVTLGASSSNGYSWSPGSATTQSITVSPSVSTTYTVNITDVNGCTASATSPVTVNTLPHVAVSPANAVCLGTTSTLLTASGASTYIWSPNTNLTPTSGTSATETVQISQLTFYTLTGTDANNCSANVVVPVATVATGGVISPNFSIICSGNTKTLTVTGAAGHDYIWQISSDNTTWDTIPGATNTTYITASGDGTTNKFYRLLSRSNTCWNVASTTAEVDVSNPTILVTAINVTDNSLILNWSPTGTGNYTISYSGPTSATLTSVTPAKAITGLSANGTYSITVTQTGVGCAASGTITGVTTLCAMPTGVTLTSPASSQILVSWTGVVGADYRVYYRPLFSYNTYFTKDVSNVSSVLLTKQGNNNLYASTTYEVYVSRLDCPGTGAVGQGTNPTNVTTKPDVSCATPQIDSVRSLCPVQIEVFIHDNGGPNLYNVFIQRITPSILAVNSYGVSGTYFTINTPYSGDQYLIAVEAKCGGALSNLYVWPGNVTIKPLCTSPNNLVLSNPTCHGFTASWNADQCLSNAASEYALYLRVSGTINYNSYGVPLPGNGIGPNKTINFVTSGRTYQVYVRSIYNCNGFVTYGPSSLVQTITTLSSGCRDEDTQQPEETKPAVQQYSADNQEVFSLYPNPNNGEFVVDMSRYSMEEDAVRIEVINMIGQTVMTHLTTISGGHLNEFINLPNGTAAGTYMVRLTAGKNVYTAKINVSK